MTESGKKCTPKSVRLDFKQNEIKSVFDKIAQERSQNEATKRLNTKKNENKRMRTNAINSYQNVSLVHRKS